MTHQLISLQEPVLDRLKVQARKITGLVWENTEGEHPVQIWRKQDRIEMRFGNRVVQSSYLHNDPHQLLLSYTRYMMLCLLLVPKPQKALHFGLGGGTLPGFLHRLFPELIQTVIEVNDAVLEAASLFFEFKEDERTKVMITDASNVLDHLDQTFDLIFLDAYGPSGAPDELEDGPFLEQVFQKLTPGGWAVGNHWTIKGDFSVYTSRWKSVFPQVLQSRTRPTANMILFGRRSGGGQILEGLNNRGRFFQEQTGLDLLKMLPNLKKVS